VNDTVFPGLYRYLPSHRVDDTGNAMLQHEVSDFIDTPYTTQQATQVMREISRGVSYFQEDNEDEDEDEEDDLSVITHPY